MSTMNEMFANYIDDFMVVYIDYILIYSKTWEEHVKHLQKVLQLLREKNSKENSRNAYSGVEKCGTSVSN